MSRILITGNNEAIDREDVTSVLIAEKHEWRVIDVPTAPNLLRSWRPDAVIVDVPGAEIFDGAGIVAALRAGEAPGSRAIVIVLSFDETPEARVAALQAGADVYLKKPINPFEFRARLIGLLGQRPAPAKAVAERAGDGKIVTFYGAKGGAGATTVAINTAIALRRKTNGRICLIDGNFQFGDHRVFLDFGNDRPGIDNIVAEGIEPENILQNLVHHETEIDLLLAPKSPELADLIGPDAVTAILEQLRRRFDYVVIDIERHVDERALRILDLSDMVCLVMTADLPCLKNMRLALEMLRGLDFAEDRIRLLLNREGAFTGINAREVETALGRRIDYAIANDFRSEIAAVNSGKPTMVARPDSPLGLGFTRLAEAIIDPKPAERVGAFDKKKSGGLLAAVNKSPGARR